MPWPVVPGRLVVAWLLLLTFIPCSWGELRILEATANLGKVRGGAPVTHQFLFSNDGPEVVELLEARTSCGCLSPRLERRTLAVGDMGVLPMFVRSLGQPAGVHTWTAQLRYRLGQVEKEVSLQVTADIVNEITMQPAALTIYTVTGLAQDLVLTDSRPQPLNVAAVRTSNPSLKADLVGQEGGRIQLRVAATAAFTAGRHDETVYIYTNDPFYRHLTVPVTVVKEVPQAVTVIPETVTLKAIPEPVTVRLRAQGGAAIEIEKVQANDPALSCRWAAGPGSWATLRIQVDKGQRLRKDQTPAVEVHLRRPEKTSILIPVRFEP